MKDDRFSRAHLRRRNEIPEGGWLPVAVIVAALFWTALAAVVLL